MSQQPAATRSRKRNALLAGTVATVIAGFVVGVDKPVAAEPVPVANVAALDVLTTEIAPIKDVTQRMVAPASDEWWGFASALAPSLGVDDVALPESAQWVATTVARAPANDGDRASFEAVYIGFDSVEQAKDFSVEGKCGCVEFRRGAISMLTPAWMSPYDLDLPDFEDEGPSIAVTGGTWEWDLGGQTDLINEHSNFPTTTYEVMNGLGFGDENASWMVSADVPRGPWVGAIDGFNPAAVDVAAVATEAESTATLECFSDNFCIEDVLFGLSEVSYVLADGVSYGESRVAAPFFGGSPADQDQTLTWGGDASLVWAWQPDTLEAALTGIPENGGSAVESMLATVNAAGDQVTVSTRFAGDPIFTP